LNYHYEGWGDGSLSMFICIPIPHLLTEDTLHSIGFFRACFFLVLLFLFFVFFSLHLDSSRILFSCLWGFVSVSLGEFGEESMAFGRRFAFFLFRFFTSAAQKWYLCLFTRGNCTGQSMPPSYCCMFFAFWICMDLSKRWVWRVWRGGWMDGWSWVGVGV